MDDIANYEHINEFRDTVWNGGTNRQPLNENEN